MAVKILLPILICVFTAANGLAQIVATRSFNSGGAGITRFVSAGGSLTDSATVRVNFTAGEPVYPPYQAPNAPVRVNSGFQNSAISTAILSPITEGLGVSNIDIFPNPTMDLLNINFEGSEIGQCNLILMSLTGVILHQQTIEYSSGSAEVHQINLIDLPAAPYILTFFKGDKVIQSFKVIKL